MGIEIEPGQRLTIHYPTTTLVQRIARLQQRQIEVCSVRDLMAQPLSIADFLRRPYQNRSRYLICAYDSDRSAWRQFYLGSIAEHASPSILRVGLYLPGDDKPFETIGPAVGPTRRDRETLARSLIVLADQAKLGNASIGVYAVDVRKVG